MLNITSGFKGLTGDQICTVQEHNDGQLRRCMITGGRVLAIRAPNLLRTEDGCLYIPTFYDGKQGKLQL
jgi:hypothetical protein